MANFHFLDAIGKDSGTPVTENFLPIDHLLSRAARGVPQQVKAQGEESAADEMVGEENLEKNVKKDKKATKGDLGNEVAECKQLCDNESGCPWTMRSLMGGSLKIY